MIISGPSGAGKSTVLRELAQTRLPFEFSISATTRAPRPGEENGVDYWFLEADDFASKREENEFLECMEVFGRGDWYGTLRQPVATGLNSGKWVVLEIDVDGAAAVLKKAPTATTIFMHPGSMAELERRLRSRGTEREDALLRRLDVAKKELERRNEYQHEVINDTTENAVKSICRIAEEAPTVELC